LPLYGKTVVFDGDSICAGLNTAQGVFENGWAGRIGPMNSMDWHNVGVSGGVITQISGVSHILSSYIDTIHTNYPNLDFLILEGGTNDADRLFNQSKEGTMSETDFSGSYDATTFIGAMETLLYKAQSYYPNTKVGFIVAQKMGRALNADNNPDPYVANRRHFFDLAIQVCKKWGVPYIDLWEEGYLNPNVSSFYDKSKTAEQNRAEGKAYYDGQHLTAVGYDVISPKIEAWMKTL
jgi:lysophospholipase L1-like esterase